MSERLLKLLSVNLNALLDADEGRRGERFTHEALSRKAKIGKGTIGRLARAETVPTVDRLEGVARVFGLQVWQLLVPDLDPHAPPELLTPELRQELEYLRALERQMEEAADRARRRKLLAGSVGADSSDDSAGSGEQQDSPRKGARE